MFLAGRSESQIQIVQQVNQLIPDGSPTGLASTINVSGQAFSIADIKVDLDITGTYNGDLYAYLVHGNGFAVLLNRVGATSSNVYGYGGSGLNVTFMDSAANGNIHYYQNVTTPAPGNQLNGLWAPDGRTVSPYAATGTQAPTASLSSFDSLTVDGDWTLFVADVSSGSLNYFTSWGLEIQPVPEPSSFGLSAVSLVFAQLMCRRRK